MERRNKTRHKITENVDFRNARLTTYYDFKGKATGRKQLSGRRTVIGASFLTETSETSSAYMGHFWRDTLKI